MGEEADKLELAREAITAKMLAERPTLREYLKLMRQVSDKCAKEWGAAGDKINEAYQTGQWYAYRDIQRRLERNQFAPDI